MKSDFAFKVFVAVIWLCASSYCADITTTNVVGDITTKVSERTAKDGKLEVRIETVYRGKTKMLQTLSRPNKQGILTVVSRSFYVGGDLAVIECDEDGNGLLDRIALYRPGTDDLEMFRRQADGSVKPESTQIVEATKKQSAVVNESMRKLMDEVISKKDLSDQEITNSLERIRQKVRDLEASKKDNRK